MIYRDKSVGNLIRISVVKLVLLKAGDELSNIFSSFSRLRIPPHYFFYSKLLLN